jgi:hypothetical protein
VIPIACATIATLGLVDAVMPWILEPVWLAQGLIRIWSRMLPLLVPWLLLFEMQRRRGESLHCPRCDYEFDYGVDPSVGHPANCPECGAAWLDQLVKGRKAPSQWRLWVYTASMFCGLLVLITAASRERSWVTAYAPTGVLLHHLASVPAIGAREVDAVWAELANRTLDPSTEAALVNQIVDSVRGSRLGPASAAMHRWFEGVIQTGRVPQTVVDRYLENRVSATLELRSPTDGAAEVLLRVIDHDWEGYGKLKPVLVRCWIEPSGAELAAKDGWYGASFRFPSSDKLRSPFVMTAPIIEPTHPSIRIPLPRDLMMPQGSNKKNEHAGKVRATVWLFWSPQNVGSSRVPPGALVADPTLDLSLQLIRTIELEVSLPSETP